MVKYGVVGALAVAVLVAAMWDSSGSKKRPGDATARADAPAGGGEGATIEGAVGGAKPPTEKPALPPVARAEEPKSSPAPDEMEKYTVLAKETLQGISRKWLGDESRWKELLEHNPRITDPKNLHKGLTLVFPKSKLPKKAEEKSESAVTGGFKSEMKAPELPASSERKYVVKSGDTLYAIAAHELGSGSRWKEIVKLNNLPGETLKKGQTLLLPPR